jgi:hypothetical protein
MWFSNYYYESDLLKMIDEIEEQRKQLRLEGKTMHSTFAEDLKKLISGKTEIKPEIKK